MNSELSLPDNDLKTNPAAANWALLFIRLVRDLLDQAEMYAVKAARERGASWAEIAAMLGVTREAASKRWGDLDG